MAATSSTISDEELFERFPGVVLNQDNIDHFRGLLEHRLLINRCQNDGYWIYPHRPMCPECWSTDVVPTEVSGKGFVYMYSVIHQGRSIKGVEFPHLTGAVELVEQAGLRYLAPIVNVKNGNVHEGMHVEMLWTEVGGLPTVAFQPAAN
jgi:hypothetical protein